VAAAAAVAASWYQMMDVTIGCMDGGTSCGDAAARGSLAYLGGAVAPTAEVDPKRALNFIEAFVGYSQVASAIGTEITVNNNFAFAGLNTSIVLKAV
jgi:hypothetical protein